MIRIGIIGCGRILAAHLRGFRLLREAGVDDFRITALCARHEGDAEAYVRRGTGPAQRPPVSSIPGDPLAVCDEFVSDFQDNVEVQVFDDYDRMIRSGVANAVHDYTLHGLHHLIAAKCAERGLHLMTQKPLSVTIGGGRAMCEAFEQSGTVLGVFENWRFQPDTIRMLSLLRSGILGTPQMLHAGAIGAWWAPDQVVAETAWRHKREHAGGIVLDMGVHQFDFVRAVAGEVDSIDGRTRIVEPVRRLRSATGHVVREISCDAEDTYFASFETTTGAIGSVHASWAGHAVGTICGSGPTIYTTKGRICGDTVQFDDGRIQTLADCYAEHIPASRQERDLPFGLDDSFALITHDWLEAIRNQRAPVTDGWEGLRDLACAWAVLESARAGRRVTLDEILSGELNTVQRELAPHFGLTD